MSFRVLCFSYWKDCEATSAMSFFSPYMYNVRIGDICAHLCHSASARSIRSAVMDRFEVILFVHAAVGVLSENILI